MKYHTGHTKMYCTKWQHNTRYMIKKIHFTKWRRKITHPIQWRVQNNNTIQAIQIRYKTNITHYTQSWTYNTILKIQYTATLRKKHFCSVENGSHTLTDKRAAHDNGLHLQSDTHHTYKERKMVSWHNIILTSIYWREKYFFCKRLISFPSMVTSLANPLIFSHSGLKIEQILPSDVMNDTIFERKNICDVS